LRGGRIRPALTSLAGRPTAPSAAALDAANAAAVKSREVVYLRSSVLMFATRAARRWLTSVV
jgi:hypothetical protein